MKNFFGERLSPKKPKFIFLFCPNNSGTTVLSQYLATQIDAYLPPYGNNEGQMAPTVISMMRNKPWSEESVFDWQFIRREWELLSEGRTFVESSPPNIVRVEQIQEVFGKDSTAVISICNPYQQIASHVRRYSLPGSEIQAVVSQWLMKAGYIKSLIERHEYFPFIKYEEFVSNPRHLNRVLSIPNRDFDVIGKSGSGGNTIQNMGARTTLFLNEAELDVVSEGLKYDKELVDYFGYKIKNGAEIIEKLSHGSGGDVELARQRRAEWERQTEVSHTTFGKKVKNTFSRFLKWY